MLGPGRKGGMWGLPMPGGGLCMWGGMPGLWPGGTDMDWGPGEPSRLSAPESGDMASDGLASLDESSEGFPLRAAGGEKPAGRGSQRVSLRSASTRLTTGSKVSHTRHGARIEKNALKTFKSNDVLEMHDSLTESKVEIKKVFNLYLELMSVGLLQLCVA